MDTESLTYGLSYDRSQKQGQYRWELITNFLIGFILIVCTMLSNYHISLSISVITFIFYLFNLYLVDNIFVWKYIILFFAGAFYVTGTIVCETAPVYLSELNIFTHYTGAVAPLVLYYWLFFAFLRVFDSLLTRKIFGEKQLTVVVGKVQVDRALFKVGGILILLLGIGMFLPIAGNPAFLLSMGRFSYARDFLPPLLSRIAYYPIYLSPLVVCFIIKDNRENLFDNIRKIILIYIPYILFLLWAGHKFGSYWLLFYSIAIPLIYKFGKPNVTIKNVLGVCLIAVSFLFLLLLFYMLRGLSFDTAIYNFGWRISAQGELWWRMYDFDSGGPIRLDAFGQEIEDIFNSILTGGAERNNGVYKLMSMFGNKSVMDIYAGTNSRLSAGGFELPFYHFKYLAFIILPLVYTPIYALLTNQFIKTSLTGEVISSVCFLVLLISFDKATKQGDWISFIAIDTLICIIIIMLRTIVVSNSRRSMALRKKSY